MEQSETPRRIVPPTRTTYTYAVLEISQAAYDEIAQKLRAAQYDHAFHHDEGEVIDMHGIALRAMKGDS